MSYEILGHTADEKFRAVGSSRPQVFSETVKAFSEIVGAGSESGEVRHDIDVKSENMEALVYDFLHSLIMLQEIEDVAVCQTEELSFEEEGDGYKIDATIWTQPIDQHMHLSDVKAPTYNEMKVDYQNGEGWVIEAVLDI